VDQTFRKLVDHVEQVIQGKHDVVSLALICLFSQGHLLIEDVPGVGKTSLAKALARSVGGTWQRIQFTPDLLPSDVTGVSVWNRATERFEFRPGGVFATVLLADEINRASPKTQSALLEAMEEGHVTVDGVTHPLGPPFMVIATQNPIELEGTYPLPEAQLDRFLMRIDIGYPDRDAEIDILEADRGHAAADALDAVITSDELVELCRDIAQVHVAPTIREYVVRLVDATRRHPDLALGASTRGALGLQRASRAWAAAAGRDFVLPDDVKHLAGPVLGHRVIPSADAELRDRDGVEVIAELLASVPVPGATGAG
jgi:MoxR-like ATPase